MSVPLSVRCPPVSVHGREADPVCSADACPVKHLVTVARVTPDQREGPVPSSQFNTGLVLLSPEPGSQKEKTDRIWECARSQACIPTDCSIWRTAPFCYWTADRDPTARHTRTCPSFAVQRGECIHALVLDIVPRSLLHLET